MHPEPSATPYIKVGAGIEGDVASTANVATSTKGGSLTVTLKRDLRDLLDIAARRLSGAVLTFAAFGATHSMVLLGGAGDRYTVRRISPKRYEIELKDGPEDVVDEMTAAFLSVKQAQFKQGRLDLADPIDADGWARMRAASWLSAQRAAAGPWVGALRDPLGDPQSEGGAG